MLAVEDYIGGRRTRRARRSTVLIALLAGAGVLGAFATLPTGANASVTSGALSQLSGEANCVGEEANSSEGNTCGTLVKMGTQDAFQIQLSPDGRNAYSVAINGDLVEYARDPANGHLNVIGCLTAGTDHCAGENVIEDVPDLGHPSSLAVSPDGKSVYVTGTEKHAVVELERNEESGLLTPMNGGKACISEESGGECEFREAKGLNEPYGVTVSPGGENVYVTAVKGEAIAEFSRGFPEGGPPGLLARSPAMNASAVVPAAARSKPPSGWSNRLGSWSAPMARTCTWRPGPAAAKEGSSPSSAKAVCWNSFREKKGA